MNNTFFDHPTEEDLERFLLHRLQEEELETVETHILACEACVTRLEDLETQIAATKMALAHFESNKKAPKTEPAAWKGWFTVQRLSWAGAAAVLAIGITLVSQFSRVPAQRPAEVALTAYRGVESGAAPLNRPLHIRLSTADLNDGPVNVEIVNGSGARVWTGSAAIRNQTLFVNVPAIRESGAHFLRVYAPSSGSGSGDLLREFAFQAK